MENEDEVENELPNEWYYRSDNEPMKIKKDGAEWTKYPDSEEIEIAYLNYIFYDKEFCIFEIENAEYEIDFNKNIEKGKQQPSKQRFVGRFQGDPYKFKNLLDEETYILSEKLVSSKENFKKNLPIKSLTLFDCPKNFLDYIYLDIIFQTLEIDKSKQTQSKDDLIQFCTDYIKTFENDKEKQFNVLKELIKDLHVDTFNNTEECVKWYTKECFVYRMINSTLRRQEFIELFKIRYIYYLLRKNLIVLSVNNDNKKLFRGTIIPIVEFDKMKNNIGVPFMFNGFISYSSEIKIAEKYLKFQKIDNSFYRILFELEADDFNVDRYASIKKFSAFPHEEEHLININTFIIITKIELKELESKPYYYVCLKFSQLENLKSKVSSEIWALKDEMKKVHEKLFSHDIFICAELLFTLKKFDKVVELLSKIKFINKIQASESLYYLGLAFRNMGQNEQALKHFLEIVEITKSLDSDKEKLGNALDQIAGIHFLQGNYQISTEFYQKSLSIFKECLNSNNPIIAKNYLNVASSLFLNGKLDIALENASRSLEIMSKIHELNHPDIISTKKFIESISIKIFNEKLNNESKKIFNFFNKK